MPVNASVALAMSALDAPPNAIKSASVKPAAAPLRLHASTPSTAQAGVDSAPTAFAASAPDRGGAPFEATLGFGVLILLVFVDVGASFEATSRSTVAGATPNVRAICRLLACGCSSLIRFAMRFRASAARDAWRRCSLCAFDCSSAMALSSVFCTTFAASFPDRVGGTNVGSPDDLFKIAR